MLAMPAQIIAQEEQKHKRERFPHYRVKDLGTLQGDISNQCLGMSNRGQVRVISIHSNGTQHAFLWTNHTGMQYLGALGGSTAPRGPD